ncbi:MAG: hypothetical protein SNJ77_04875 [Cytophagales bacterium]
MKKLFFFWVFPLFLFAQNKELDMDGFIQELFSIQENDLNYNDIYESVYQYFRQPMNLNKATRTQLGSLYILSELQLNSFFEYREQNGDLLSIYELQAIPYFNKSTIDRLLPLVYVSDGGLQSDNRSIWQKIREEDNHYMVWRTERQVEPKRGYSENATASQRYEGDPMKIYGRYRIQHFNDFSLGITVEKDPGERMDWNPGIRKYGFDFFSYHFMVKNRGKLKALVIGDFQMQFGQGLVLSSGFFIGKGSETVTTVRRNNLGIRPYTSVLESNFMRGTAATYQLSKRLNITGFLSSIRADGNVNSLAGDTTINSEEFLSTVYNSGLHRTEREMANRLNILKNEYGYNFSFSSLDKKLHIGTTHLTTHFVNPGNVNRPLALAYFTPKENETLNLKRNSLIYNQFEFSGTTNRLWSLDYQYTWQNFGFFGEFAISSSGGKGFVNGFLASLSPQLDFSMVYRNYQRNFHSFYGNAFGEATRNINERGLYTGIKYQPNRKWILAAYYDKFTFPWLAFLADNPTSGYEYLARLTHKPTRKITLYLQFREERKDRNFKNNTTVSDFTTKTIRQNWMLNMDYNEDKLISFRTRFQHNSFFHAGNWSRGAALVQDLVVNVKKKFKVSSRFALFQTDDYDSRIYVFENDVLYSFTIPAYNGRGIRNYIIFNYKASKKLELWFRYARTTYRDRNIIGSAGERIDGNTDSDWKLQARWKF